MSRKKIGFFQNEIDENEEVELKDLKSYVKIFIDSNYSSSGDTEQKEFKTSTELIYMFRESFDVSINLLNEVMEELVFKMIFIDQIPCWVLYSKQIIDDE